MSISQQGDISVVRGCDYQNANGMAFDWTDDSNAWPTLTSATINVSVYGTFEDGTAVKTWSGSVVTATGSSKKVRLELAAGDTSDLDAGVYQFNVLATLDGSGDIVPLVRGQMILREE